MDTASYIKEHINDDVRMLALGQHPSGVNIREALVQISGYQSASSKLPDWVKVDGIKWPEHISMEQCTSQALAVFKAGIIDGILAPGFKMADLTGGMGVDCFYLSRNAASVYYNDIDSTLCAIAENNFPRLGRRNVVVSNKSAEDFLVQHSNERFGLIYIDPSRRSKSGGRMVSLKNCQPDITALQGTMMSISDTLVVKMSPMLDISVALSELSSVMQLWVLSLAGECKEILAVMRRDFSGEPEILAVDIASDVASCGILRSTSAADAALPLPIADVSMVRPGNYLYEPFPSLMKSGLYRTLCRRYDVSQLHPNSHLYVSDKSVTDFPGRRFGMVAVAPFDKHSAKRLFQTYPRACITTRNFPLTANALRDKYHILDGEPYYIFATTAAPSQKVLIVSKRI